jgi:hypothetical protein
MTIHRIFTFSFSSLLQRKPKPLLLSRKTIALVAPRCVNIKHRFFIDTIYAYFSGMKMNAAAAMMHKKAAAWFHLIAAFK